MAVIVQIFPQPVVHSVAFEVFVSGLTPGNTYALYTNNITTASSAASGTADPEGNLAATITAAAPTGLWFLNVVNTTSGTVPVASVSFTQS